MGGCADLLAVRLATEVVGQFDTPRQPVVLRERDQQERFVKTAPNTCQLAPRNREVCAGTHT